MAKLKTASNKKKATKSVASKRLVKKATKKNGMSLYSNLAYKRRVKEDMRARKKAEELAKLPKNPFLRFFARLRPDRVFKAIFSKEGLIRILKFIVVCILLMIIAVGGLFLYFKKDLSEIDPEELASRVQNTVNTYYDRNGELLWEDKGDGDYRLVVDGSEISSYMRQATVAIEDRNFYNHAGVDLGGIARAVYVTVLKRGSVQGGSTLTQQLIKQVYFSDEAKDRSFSGIPRKIKEMILAIEVEKMYDKEQIITMYLNESPYGGRRNGVESAAQTYFKKSAKDLDLAESALLAAIPNNPGVLNPYNIDGNKALLQRQHYVLDAMVDMNYITEEEAEKAKKVDILDKLQPEQNQYAGMKAPWFVLEVKSQLEKKYGIKTMREGGFKIKTTIDLRAQKLAEEAV
nr:penicillin-binding protein [Candidatus Saccharibacteria bacterium]